MVRENAQEKMEGLSRIQLVLQLEQTSSARPLHQKHQAGEGTMEKLTVCCGKYVGQKNDFMGSLSP